MTRPACGLNVGAVERVSDDPDQLARHAARQPRVAVERDAVLDLRQDGQIADRHGEARVGGAAQQAVELLDLAALALPSHPQPFALVPLAQAVKQEEAVGAAVRVPCVERGDAGARGLEDLRVVRQRLGRRVEKVAEDGEMDVRVDVAERLHFEVRDQVARRAPRCRTASARSPSSGPTAAPRRARAAAAGAAGSGS